MDVDHHHIKDVENLRGEAVQPVQPHQPANHSPGCRIPPIKPRRNPKLTKTPPEGAGPIHQSASDQKNETVVKRTSPALTLGAPGPLEPLSPSLRAHTLLWFQRTQLPRLRQPGRPLPCWLHGFATRREAEELLKVKPQGCFLLRLSESKIGFVLSYRGKDRCRHFMVEEEEQEEEEEGGAKGKGGSYLITGDESRHGSLQELISYYTQNPVGPFDETLTIPCGEDSAPALNPGDNDAAAQYAVVRKVLKKSLSQPEPRPAEPLLTQRGEELNVPNCMKQDDLSVAGACGGDVQYARVNKPPRSQAASPGNKSPYVNIGSLSEQQGPSWPSVPLVWQGSAGDLGHWQPEPLDTYEEPPRLVQREQESQEQIDFYAVGRWRDVEGSADSTHQNLYSQVNLRGSREIPPAHMASPVRAALCLPSRPPTTASHCHDQQEAMAQGGTLMTSTSPSRQRPLTGRDSGSDIYGQIPERPAASGSRPPLPPPNPKRKP